MVKIKILCYEIIIIHMYLYFIYKIIKFYFRTMVQLYKIIFIVIKLLIIIPSYHTQKI